MSTAEGRGLAGVCIALMLFLCLGLSRLELLLFRDTEGDGAAGAKAAEAT